MSDSSDAGSSVSKGGGWFVVVVLSLLSLGLVPSPVDASDDYKMGHASFDALPRVLRVIAWCESSFDPQAANPSSSARGLFQFIESTWRENGFVEQFGASEAHHASIHDQSHAALILYSRRGAQPWDVNGRASVSCRGLLRVR